MHRIFQTFIDSLSESVDLLALRKAMADAAEAFELPRFAYLVKPHRLGTEAQLISTCPSAWTGYYLASRYERLDTWIIQALQNTEPFQWGLGVGRAKFLKRRQQLFDEAAQFGIRCGFTIPIHDGRGPIAAVTFATDVHRPEFQHCIEAHGRVLQLMAMYFHAHARRKLGCGDRLVDGVLLSPREFDCLQWAMQGKTAWEIGRILGISRRIATFHLENAKAKFRVCSLCQAVARLAAAKPTMQ